MKLSSPKPPHLSLFISAFTGLDLRVVARFLRTHCVLSTHI